MASHHEVPNRPIVLDTGWVPVSQDRSILHGHNDARVASDETNRAASVRPTVGLPEPDVPTMDTLRTAETVPSAYI